MGSVTLVLEDLLTSEVVPWPGCIAGKVVYAQSEGRIDVTVFVFDAGEGLIGARCGTSPRSSRSFRVHLATFGRGGSGRGTRPATATWSGVTDGAGAAHSG